MEKVIQRLWTLEELEILLDMMKKGSKLKDIAERLNRSYGSIQVKVKSMGKDLWDRSSWSRYISKRTKKTSHSSRTLAGKINIMGSDFWEERNWEMYTVG